MWGMPVTSEVQNYGHYFNVFICRKYADWPICRKYVDSMLYVGKADICIFNPSPCDETKVKLIKRTLRGLNCQTVKAGDKMNNTTQIWI